MNSHIVLLFLGLLSVTTFTCAQDTEDTMYVLWDKTISFPNVENLHYPEGVVDVMVHRAGLDSL